MKGLSAIKPTKENSKKDTQKENSGRNIPDVRATKLEQMRSKISGLGGLRISSPSRTSAPVSADVAENTETLILAQPTAMEEEPLLLVDKHAQVAGLPNFDNPLRVPALYIVAAGLTAAWLGFSISYAFMNLSAMSMAPHALGAFLAGVFSPPALLWLLVTSMNRRADVRTYSAALRLELQSMLFPEQENSGLINKDIERLCGQAAEVSSSSRAVLKSLQRARQGLRAEIRDFSGVSKKAEFHIDRLAETLHERAAKLVALTDEIEQRVAGIDAKTKEGADAWDQATLIVLERAGEIESAMGKGADKILEAANKAQEKSAEIKDHLAKSYDSLNESIDNTAARLEGLGARFDGYTNGLAEAAERVNTETSRLGDMIKGQVENLEGVTGRTVEAMTKSTETIR